MVRDTPGYPQPAIRKRLDAVHPPGRFDRREIGYRSAMDETPRTWQWLCPSPVRQDADSLFVPCTAVPGARVGDIIIVRAESGGEARSGTIAATSKGDGETFFRVALEP